MAISTINQAGLNAPLTLTSPVLSGTTTATTVTSPAATALTLQSAGTTAATVTTAQNVGIGITAPISKLNVKAGYVSDTGIQERFEDNTGVALDFGGTGGGVKWLNVADVGSGSAYPLAFQTVAGNVYVGTTTPPSGGGVGVGFQKSISGSPAGNMTMTWRANNDSTTDVFYFYSLSYLSGYIRVSGNTTSYVTTSDYRLKDNVAPMTGALAKVQALKPVTYTWKSSGQASQGFIAHELAEVVPECVTGEKDDVDEDGNIKPQGIDTSFLVATLTAAIQELKAEFDAYKRAHP